MKLTGRSVAPIEPGSAPWLETISASKIPAILGISPWQSPYSLWHQMAGTVGRTEETNETRRGHYLEPAVAAWFADQHPDFMITDGGSWRHEIKDTWTAAPDRIAYTPDKEVFGVEIKSAAYADEWGKPGTADIPPYYLAQVAWQMYVLGVDRIYVPIITGFLEFREYVVNREDIVDDLPVIIDAVLAFEQSLADRTPPAIEGADATYQTIRRLHPDIDGEVVELEDYKLAEAFIKGKSRADYHNAEFDSAKNQLAAFMGGAKKVTWQGRPLATRQSRGGGAPYLVVSKKLPDVRDERVTTTTTEQVAA